MLSIGVSFLSVGSLMSFRSCGMVVSPMRVIIKPITNSNKNSIAIAPAMVIIVVTF